MPTKRQQEIREWCLSNLEADEKILWYGEAETNQWQHIVFQFSKFARSLNFELPNMLVQMACAGLLSFVTISAGIVFLGLGLLFFTIMPVVGIFGVVGGFAFLVLGSRMFPLILASMQKDLPQSNTAHNSEIVQKVAYIITNYRILRFDQEPYGEFPLELLDDSILSKAKDGFSNISLYRNFTPKSKNPQPNYVLRAIPEEDAQTAYIILREARDYAERVREREIGLEKQKRL